MPRFSKVSELRLPERITLENQGTHCISFAVTYVLYPPIQKFFLGIDVSIFILFEICNYNQVLITAEKIFGGLKFTSTLPNNIVQLFVQKGTIVQDKSYRTQKSQIVSLCLSLECFFYNVEG